MGIYDHIGQDKNYCILIKMLIKRYQNILTFVICRSAQFIAERDIV